jgi:hypothetical protein
MLRMEKIRANGVQVRRVFPVSFEVFAHRLILVVTISAALKRRPKR